MMNSLKLNIVFFLTISLILPHAVSAQTKLKRSESFFGFHFDFHATLSDKELGKNFDTNLLDSFLKLTKPDYIQIDSKGHPGISSYPTTVGYSANSFVKDPIRIWKDIADKNNIPLYVHYSGIWDEEAIRQNPEWGRLNADGSRDKTRVGYYSDYIDKLMIPQLKEMIDNYNIDGAWIDGDCWAALLDYSPEVAENYLHKTGFKVVPVNPEDDNFESWKEHNRDAFKEYMRHYVDEMHRYRPGFQITSNWAYSSYMPEPVDINLDFLSGDVAGRNSVYSAAFEARCMALQGKPWDLMSWGMIPVNFWGGTHTPKPVIQLKQEAAQVIAMGGGYQVYFRQNRDGAFATLDFEGLTSLTTFVRERQPFCQYSETVPQIGIWYSLEGWKKETNQSSGVYSGGTQRIKGILNLLLDGQHSAEILMDHHMKGRMENYPLIVIPEWKVFDEKRKDQLLNYVKEGGNVLVIGAEAVKQYEDFLDVTFEGRDTSGVELMIGGKSFEGIAGLRTTWQPVKPAAGVTEIGQIFSQTDYRYTIDFPVATINRYGKGQIGAIYMDLSPVHGHFRNPVFSNLLKEIINHLVPDISLSVHGTNEVHTILGKKNENILIHLINTSGHHANENVFGFDELRPTPALTISLKVDAKPKGVLLQPTGKKLDFKYRNNRIEFVVPPVDVYDIVEVLR